MADSRARSLVDHAANQSTGDRQLQCSPDKQGLPLVGYSSVFFRGSKCEKRVSRVSFTRTSGAGCHMSPYEFPKYLIAVSQSMMQILSDISTMLKKCALNPNRAGVVRSQKATSICV